MRLEVPLHIVPTDHISQPCLDSLVDLPRIISQEEEDAYTKTTRVPDMDLVTRIHNGAGSCHLYIKLRRSRGCIFRLSFGLLSFGFFLQINALSIIMCASKGTTCN